MATATKEILKAESMDVLAAKGYHAGRELKKCEAENINAYVSPKAPATPDNGLYPVTTFTCNPEDYTYTCPASETLRTNNFWYKHSGKGKTEAYRFLQYTAWVYLYPHERKNSGVRRGWARIYRLQPGSMCFNTWPARIVQSTGKVLINCFLPSFLANFGILKAIGF